MRTLITGGRGQLGRALLAATPAGIEVAAPDREQLDLTVPASIDRSIEGFQPALILNAAAYTAVDRAESERDVAWAVNAFGVEHVARAAESAGARLIHVSTDFVFDGLASEPYRPGDHPAPVSVYGRSKLAGELAALEHRDAAVVRTARVYAQPGRNFVTTMLGLMAGRDEVRVVDDQIGSPTRAVGLADVLWRLALRSELTGIWHWTDGGSCSFYQWARTIQERALKRSLLEHQVPLHAISTNEYPAPAPRPAFSVLDCTATVEVLDVVQTPWEVALNTMLDEMAASRPTPT